MTLIGVMSIKMRKMAFSSVQLNQSESPQAQFHTLQLLNALIME